MSIKHFKNKFLLSFFLVCFLSCKDNQLVNPQIKAIQLDVELIRFDSIFAHTSPKDLEVLKQNYPFMFNTNYSDSLWVLKMTDSLQNEIEKEVIKTFNDFTYYHDNIILFYKHLQYYFPKEKTPKIITLADYVDYNSKVVLHNDILYIYLDNYLGKDHPYYASFKEYTAQLQDKNQLMPDIAQHYANTLVPFPERRDFISQLVYHGKQLYLKQTLLPLVEEHHIIGYTKEDWLWAESQEFMIWQYFVEKDLIYDSDPDLRRRFLLPGPFTKFYTEIDNETPPRLGQYLGWKIVQAYAQKNAQQTLQQILTIDAHQIFNSSNYKPNQ